MKKLLIAIMVLVLLFTGACVTYDGAGDQSNGGNNDGTTQTPPDQNPGGEEQAPTQNAFTAKLRLNGEDFIPDASVFAQWSDGFNFFRANFDQSGVATATGLDGDYSVTLFGLPEGITYNPNAYKATNVNRDVVIDLHPIITTKKSGKDLYSNIIEINKTGVYRTEITSQNHVVYYQYAPRSSGKYTIESWMDITANDVNPQVEIYYGSIAFKVYAYTMDDGGASSTYTKNFKYEVSVSDDMLGNIFAFGIRCYSRSSSYPLTVDFSLKYQGAFSRDDAEAPIIVPTEMKPQQNYSPDLYEWKYPEVDYGSYRAFDGSMFKYNEETGYYHVYDKQTQQFGPILYAHITSAPRCLDKPLTQIEYAGNKNLTVENNTQNYKHFIEGYNALVANNYYCSSDCSCKGGCVSMGEACLVSENCQSCTDACRPCPDELYQLKGYADYANIDGVHGVTKELKDFLQKFCVSQRYFMDGNGWAEISMNPTVDASENDQWLIFCGYYDLK